MRAAVGLIGLLLLGNFGVSGRSQGRLAVRVDLLHVEVVIESVDLHLVHGGEQWVGGVGALAFGDLLEGEAVGE